MHKLTLTTVYIYRFAKLFQLAIVVTHRVGEFKISNVCLPGREQAITFNHELNVHGWSRMVLCSLNATNLSVRNPKVINFAKVFKGGM